MMLSLDCIINGASPKARHGRVSFKLILRFLSLNLRIEFLLHKKLTTQMQEKAWEIIVASAAPLTPISRTKMKTGSKTMLDTAPINTESIPCFAKPCAVM